MKTLYKIFKYIEPLWLGRNKKVSIRSVLAIAFSINFMVNLQIEEGKLMIEAGLIASLLALRTYAAVQGEKIQAENKESKRQPDNPDEMSE